MRTAYHAALMRWHWRWLSRLLGLYEPGGPRPRRSLFVKARRLRGRAAYRLGISDNAACRALATRIEDRAEVAGFRQWLHFDQTGGR